MKRLLISACAVVVVLAMTAPALALDFGAATLKGYFRTRAWWWAERDLNDDADPNNTTHIDGRLRIEPTWKINDNVTLKQRWELDLGNFEGPIVDRGTGSGDFDRQELDINRAWAEIKLPFGKFSFGRMPFSWGEKIIDNGSENDGFRLDMKFGPLTVFPFYFKALEDSRDILDDMDEFGVGLLYKMEWLQAGIMTKYIQGYTSTAPAYFHGSRDRRPQGPGWPASGIQRSSAQEFNVGPYVKLAFGPFIASTEWMFRFGTSSENPNGEDRDNEAFSNAAGILKLQYNAKPFIIIAEGGWSKGERIDMDTGEPFILDPDEAYRNDWHSDRDVDVILWEKIEGQVNNGGFVRVEGTWQATKKLKLVAQGIYSFRDQAPRDVDHAMGFEIDGWVSYSLVDNFQINLTGGYFFSGDYFDDLAESAVFSAPRGGVTGDDDSYLLKAEFRVFF